MIGRTNAVVGSVSKLPTFTYTGSYTLLDDGDDNWRIKFLTSGTFTLAKSVTCDIFCVGGGAGGGYSTSWGGGGGAGGYTSTVSGVVAVSGISIPVVIGAGGASFSAGGNTYFKDIATASASGGDNGIYPHYGGNGGSGGGAGARYSTGSAGIGGSNGANGADSTGTETAMGGTGQGTTTREFGEATGTLYAGSGGGGAGSSGTNSAAGSDGGGHGGNANTVGGAATNNTGSGGGGAGGGAAACAGGAGGSGIIVIRNHRAA